MFFNLTSIILKYRLRAILLHTISMLFKNNQNCLREFVCLILDGRASNFVIEFGFIFSEKNYANSLQFDVFFFLRKKNMDLCVV